MSTRFPRHGRPAAGTAVAAMLLAGAGSLAWLCAAITSAIAISRLGTATEICVWMGLSGQPLGRVAITASTYAADLAVIPLLAVGLLLLAWRRSAGQILIALGCLDVLGCYVVITMLKLTAHTREWIGSLTRAEQLDHYFAYTPFDGLFGTDLDVPLPGAIALLLFPVGTLLLVVLPSTSRWVRAARF